MRAARGVAFMVQVELRGDAGGPLVGERGSDGRFAAVLGKIRERTALGDGAEGLGIFAGEGDVVGIEREECVDRGVGAAPEEGLGPGVGRLRAPGKIDVDVGGELDALDGEHGDGGGDYEECGKCAEQAARESGGCAPG